jgi:hypothetical protein
VVRQGTGGVGMGGSSEAGTGGRRRGGDGRVRMRSGGRGGVRSGGKRETGKEMRVRQERERNAHRLGYRGKSMR